MTAKKKTVIGYVLASLAIIAADQALKAWVVRNIPLNASAAQQRALIPGVVHLTHIRNSGVAFGMFSGGRWLFLALLAALLTARCRNKWTAALPPVLCNAILIGALIAWEEAGVGNGFPPAFFYNALTVGLGEAVACYVLGIPLLGVMQKHLKLN